MMKKQKVSVGIQTQTSASIHNSNQFSRFTQNKTLKHSLKTDTKQEKFRKSVKTYTYSETEIDRDRNRETEIWRGRKKERLSIKESDVTNKKL